MQTKPSKAYIAGLIKGAQACGVDPVELVKRAQLKFDLDSSTYNNNVTNKGYGNSLAEDLGKSTSTLTLGAAGGLLGSRVPRGMPKARRLGRGVTGAVAGVSAGILGNLIGKITGISTRTRTRNEQLSHDSVRHNLANLLLPGVAAYNGQKRQERVLTGLWHS